MTDGDLTADEQDRFLLAAHLAGDPLALDTLLRGQRQRMWAVAYRTLGDAEEAADAVQDACLSAFRSASGYRGDAKVSTWLHRIVVNACLDRLRRQAVRPTVPLPDQPPADPRDLLAERETTLAVRAALRNLPEQQRAAIVLVDLTGMSVEEAALVLDVPPGTVKSRCFRGRAQLALSLGHLREPSLQPHPQPLPPAEIPAAPSDLRADTLRNQTPRRPSHLQAPRPTREARMTDHPADPADHPSPDHPSPDHLLPSHLDADALADVLAGEAGATQQQHLAGCTTCQRELATLRTALEQVAADLASAAASPVPAPPEDLDARITAALADLRSAADATAAAPSTEAVVVPAQEPPHEPSSEPSPETPAPAAATPSRTASTTVTPLEGRPSRRRWLPATGAVAAAAVLVTGVVLLFTKSTETNSTKSASSAPTSVSAAAAAHPKTSDTGTNYLRNGIALKANLPDLLAGAPVRFLASASGSGTAPRQQSTGTATPAATSALVPSTKSSSAPADGLTRLHTPAGLTSCLSGLIDPSDPIAPLALDYARYQGQPALVVVFPSVTAGKLDVFIVGRSCTAAESDVLLYAPLDKPS